MKKRNTRVLSNRNDWMNITGISEDLRSALDSRNISKRSRYEHNKSSA
jgi:hypothetical protein